MALDKIWIVSAVIIASWKARSHETIPNNTVTPYSNLTRPFLENDDQTYRHISDVSETKNNNVYKQNKENRAYEVKNTHSNRLDGTVKLPDRSVCGPLSEEERIYGGENTAIDEFPWLVRIKYILDNGKEVYACAGSLLTDNYVLTAAHCAVNLTIKEVRLGDWNLQTEYDCQGSVCIGHAVDVKVVKVIPFPNYTKMDTFKGDIALLKLQRPVNFTDFIRPICLPTTKFVANQDYSPGSTYWTAGWGKTEFEKKPAIKRKVELNAVPVPECRRKQPILSDDTVSFTICAGGTDGKDTCVGDSGGSLVKQVTENSTTNWFLMGVTSYGYKECGSEGRPGLYARITPYMDWIIHNIES
ncbi:CLIP domain-containing serine protease HP8-like [Ostrinia nubilalis]|uniref:CLIP domain-containing serine protease HP8-like n=1 Tax=Ostrinia nubilalis TaxID=29057 RepID=UPI003082273E